MKKKFPRPLIVAIAAWDTAWKAAALLRAYRNRQRRWLLPLLLTNSAGVLPIAYLLFFQRTGEEAEA